MVKLKICKYAYLCIFRLTFQSPKLILKADLKRESPYFYFKFVFKEFWSIFIKKKWIFCCIFKKWFDRRSVFFLWNFFLKKPNTPKYALGLGGSMLEAQIKQCLLPYLRIIIVMHYTLLQIFKKKVFNHISKKFNGGADMSPQAFM